MKAPAKIRSVGSASDVRSRDELLYRFLVESLTECAVFAVSSDGFVMSWNSGAQNIFGYTQAEIVGRSFDVLFDPGDAETGSPHNELAGALDGRRTHHDRWLMRKDGTRFWGTNTVQPLFDAAGLPLGCTILIRDTTASHVALQELSDSEQKLRLLVGSVRDYAIFSVGCDGAVTSWTAGAQSLFGYDASILGSNFSVLLHPAEAADRLARDELRAAERHESIDVECRMVRKDGSTFLAAGKTSRLAPGTTGGRRGFVKIVHDATARHAADEDLRRRAQCDELTELPNRRTFYEHVECAISRVGRRPAHRFAVLFVDLDRFKAVNDEFGHLIADRLLSVVARRLEACVRDSDIVARVGGDEFAILLDGIDGVADADDAAARILAHMRQPMRVDAGDVFVSVSIGIAMGTPRYSRPEEIIQDADLAMYRAKTQGRARAVLFDREIANLARQATELTTDLRYAIERNELRFFFQPVLRLIDRATVGFEALARWQHPRRGLLRSADFIPLAEASNLVVAIDRTMVFEACAVLARWQTDRLVPADLQMSVNVSSRELLREEFATEIHAALIANGLDARALRLEITLGTVLERSARASTVLASIRALGVRVDVDDFGSGYASLGHLLVDGIKVDWSAMTRMNAGQGWEIIESVISLAHKLGLVAIAKEIETPEQLRQLVALKCEFGQGSLLAPPLSALDALAYLRAVRAAPLCRAQ